MSLRALVWAFSQIRDGRVSKDSAKLILLKLADRANDDGTCWPGRESLGLDVGISEITARAATKILEDAQLIQIERRKDAGGRDLSNLYHLLMAEGEGSNFDPRGSNPYPQGKNPDPRSSRIYPESSTVNQSSEPSLLAGLPAWAVDCLEAKTWNRRDASRFQAIVDRFGDDTVARVAQEMQAAGGGARIYVSALVAELDQRFDNQNPTRRDAAESQTRQRRGEEFWRVVKNGGYVQDL
jgi:hypothetical protein